MDITLELITPKWPELDLIAAWRNQTMATLRSCYPTDQSKQLLWVQSLNQGATEYYYYIYSEVEKDLSGNGLIGYCGLDKVNPCNKTAEISLLVGQPYQGMGFGSRAVKKLLQIAFDDLNLNCVFAECYTTTKTWDFWEKCGFIKEGTLRARKRWQGQFWDSIIGSVVRSDYENRAEINCKHCRM